MSQVEEVKSAILLSTIMNMLASYVEQNQPIPVEDARRLMDTIRGVIQGKQDMRYRLKQLAELLRERAEQTAAAAQGQDKK